MHFFCGNLSAIAVDVFDLCENLQSVLYLGTSYPKVLATSSILLNMTALICVSESYSSTLFCGRNVSSGDLCFDLIIEGDTCFKKKKDSLVEWEKKSNACVNYSCDNETGFLSFSLCNGTDQMVTCTKDGKCNYANVSQTHQLLSSTCLLKI